MATLLERYQGLQTRLLSCGKTGCYFLALCSIAEEATGEKIDLISAIYEAISHGFTNERFEIFPEDSLSILRMLTRKPWSLRKEKSLDDVVLTERDFIVYKWHNSHLGHFRNRNQRGYIHFKRKNYDFLTKSPVVRGGKIIQYYIYTYCIPLSGEI